MQNHVKLGVTLAVALLMALGLSVTNYAQIGACYEMTAKIIGPEKASVGETITLVAQGMAKPHTGSICRNPSFKWTLVEAPDGAKEAHSSAAALKYTFEQAGTYTFHVIVTMEGIYNDTNTGGASHKVIVAGRGSSPATNGGCEFAGSTLYPAFSMYIPKAGPSFSLSANPGYLRMSLPSSGGFDHWTENDTAPQLRAVAPSGDWEISTRLRVLTPTSLAGYQAGLMVVFSKQDILYWGPYQGQEIRLERSGLRPGVRVETPLAHAGNDVELQIAKQGTNYAFSYRAAGSDTWQLVGNYTASETPQFVGLIIKAWQIIHLEVDFDYLHLPGC